MYQNIVKINQFSLMINKKIILLTLFIFFINNSSAATVELTSGALPSSLREGDQINLTAEIKELQDNNLLTIETSLIPAGDKPLYDFGELNAFVNENRYQQKITLNLSSLNRQFIYVTISGKAPDAGNNIKCGNSDLVITKFDYTKLKFYEISADTKLIGIESFDLIILKKENFEKTLQQMNWDQLNELKKETRNLFDLGLVNDAQILANSMKNIQLPSSLLLFGFIAINNNTWLNIIFLISILVCFIIGYLLGSRKQYFDDNEE
ncbi:MAG: hypothetical protein FIB08_16095 [Candidatus Methanoperedens sp.]|nr:hypothetical protein [Candidatus Methanoperedens sp.]